MILSFGVGQMNSMNSMNCTYTWNKDKGRNKGNKGPLNLNTHIFIKKRGYSTKRTLFKNVDSNVDSNVDISILKEFKNEKISEILNNANLDKNRIIELDNTLIRLVSLLEIIKGDVNVEEVNKIKKEIYSEVKNLGIDTIKVKKLFKEYVNSFDNLARNEREINEINNYMNEINSIIQSKKVDIASKVKNKLIRF